MKGQVIPGNVCRSNKGSLVVSRYSGLLAYGCQCYVVIVDPYSGPRHVQILDGHSQPVCLAEWLPYNAPGIGEAILTPMSVSDNVQANHFLITVDTANNVFGWNVFSGVALWTTVERRRIIDVVCISRHKDIFVCLLQNFTVSVRSMTDGSEICRKSLSSEEATATCIAIHNDYFNDYFFVGSSNSTVYIGKVEEMIDPSYDTVPSLMNISPRRGIVPVVALIPCPRRSSCPFPTPLASDNRSLHHLTSLAILYPDELLEWDFSFKQAVAGSGPFFKALRSTRLGKGKDDEYKAESGQAIFGHEGAIMVSFENSTLGFFCRTGMSTVYVGLAFSTSFGIPSHGRSMRRVFEPFSIHVRHQTKRSRLVPERCSYVLNSVSIPDFRKTEHRNLSPVSRLAVLTGQGRLSIWEFTVPCLANQFSTVTEFKLKKMLDSVGTGLSAIKWHPKPSTSLLVAMGLVNGQMLIWDSICRRFIVSAMVHGSKVTSIDWLSDFKLVSSSSTEVEGGVYNNEVMIYDIRSGFVHAVRRGEHDDFFLRSVLLSPIRRTLMVVTSNNHLDLYDLSISEENSGTEVVSTLFCSLSLSSISLVEWGWPKSVGTGKWIISDPEGAHYYSGKLERFLVVDKENHFRFYKTNGKRVAKTNKEALVDVGISTISAVAWCGFYLLYGKWTESFRQFSPLTLR